MKKGVFSILMAIATDFVFAQLCDPIGIKTDASSPFNPQRTEVVNGFDWTQQHNWQAYYKNSNTVNNLQSPFYSFSGGSEVSKNLSYGADSDFNPKDGWELLKINFGKLVNGNNRNQNLIAPYAIFYNKYTTKLRVLAIMQIQNLNYVGVTLTYDPTKDGSALFNNMRPVSASLDSLSPKSSVSVTATAPNDPTLSHFFYADFDMAYDPCACNRSSEIEVSFFGIWEANMVGSGIFKGDVITVPTETTSQFPNQANWLSLGSSALKLGGNIALAATGLPSQGWAIVGGGIEFTRAIVNLTGLNDTDKASLQSVLDFASTSADVGATLNGGIDDFTFTYNKEVIDANGNVTYQATTGTWRKDAIEKAYAKVSDYMSKINKKIVQKAGGTYISGTMQFSGTVTWNPANQNTIFRFPTPGSLGSASWTEEASVNQAPEYPVYNEVLGLFTLLKTPVVKRIARMDNTNSNPTYSYSWEVDASTLKYAINPVANINWNNSRIWTNLEVKLVGLNEKYASTSVSGNNSDSLYRYINYKETGMQYLGMEPVYRVPIQTGVNGSQQPVYNAFYDKIVFQSEYIPFSEVGRISCSYAIAPKWWPDLPNHLPAEAKLDMDTVYLNFYLDLVSNNLDKDGQPVKIKHKLKYPVSYNNLPYANMKYDLNRLPTSISDGNLYKNTPVSLVGNFGYNYTGTKVISTSQKYFSHPRLKIRDAVISTQNNAQLELVGAYEVTVNGESSATGETSAYTWDGVLQNVQNISSDPADKTYLQTFCTTQYQGYKFKPTPPSARLDGSSLDHTESISTMLSVYPNPAHGMVNLELSISSESQINMYLTDILGIKIADIAKDETIGKGTHTYGYSTEGLAGGIYLYTAEINGEKYTKRLVVVK